MKRLTQKVLTALGAISMIGMTAFATVTDNAPVGAVSMTGTMNYNGITKFLTVVAMMATWMQFVGLAVAFFGAVQLGFGFRTDDAEAKAKGMRSMISGFIVFAIALAVGFFFNV